MWSRLEQKNIIKFYIIYRKQCPFDDHLPASSLSSAMLSARGGPRSYRRRCVAARANLRAARSPERRPPFIACRPSICGARCRGRHRGISRIFTWMPDRDQPLLPSYRRDVICHTICSKAHIQCLYSLIYHYS